jgi:hypothetical protein
MKANIDKPYHGDYYSPGQGRSHFQYANTLKVLDWIAIIGVVVLVIIVAVEIF